MGNIFIERRTFLRDTAGMVAGLFAAKVYAADNPDPEAPGKEKRKRLFNGKDLSGWRAEGGAVWTVEDECIVGVQGPNGEAGDLFTEQEYADFDLRVSYKIQWPANSGVWFRYQAPDKAYQADILEYKDPEAYSGTLYCPGKMFLAVNKDPSIVKKDDWNTMGIRAEGDHLVITLNGTVTADVRDASHARGKIGFQIHAGDEFKNMKLTVRRVALRPLAA